MLEGEVAQRVAQLLTEKQIAEVNLRQALSHLTYLKTLQSRAQREGESACHLGAGAPSLLADEDWYESEESACGDMLTYPPHTRQQLFQHISSSFHPALYVPHLLETMWLSLPVDMLFAKVIIL